MYFRGRLRATLGTFLRTCSSSVSDFSAGATPYMAMQSMINDRAGYLWGGGLASLQQRDILDVHDCCHLDVCALLPISPPDPEHCTIKPVGIDHLSCAVAMHDAAPFFQPM